MSGERGRQGPVNRKSIDLIDFQKYLTWLWSISDIDTIEDPGVNQESNIRTRSVVERIGYMSTAIQDGISKFLQVTVQTRK